MRVRTIQEVAEYQLCSGCGACAYLAPTQIRMVDAIEYGRRPWLMSDPGIGDAVAAMAVCPGVGLDQIRDYRSPGLLPDLRAAWGPVYEVWEGYAADEQIRRAGSSGGAASALALYAIEQGGMHGVLHTAARADVPYLNRTVMSRSRAEILARTGSRYAPASPCDGLQWIEDAPAPCVFIGKPCDVAAVQKARALRPGLEAKTGLTIAFFCAGTPSTRGTLELLRRAGVERPETVMGLRYRGNGWPGELTVRYRDPDDQEQTHSLSYFESWGFLTKYVQWRCRLCPDRTGEFADIAVGDPWYRSVVPGEPGQSLVIARTSRGRELLHAAEKAGYLVLEKSDPELLPRSQPGLLRSRGEVWGRLWALRLAGLPRPRFTGIPMGGVWLRSLGFSDKLRSILGTWLRIRRRGLRARHEVVPAAPASPETPLRASLSLDNPP